MFWIKSFDLFYPAPFPMVVNANSSNLVRPFKSYDDTDGLIPTGNEYGTL